MVWIRFTCGTTSWKWKYRLGLRLEHFQETRLGHFVAHVIERVSNFFRECFGRTCAERWQTSDLRRRVSIEPERIALFVGYLHDFKRGGHPEFLALAIRLLDGSNDVHKSSVAYSCTLVKYKMKMWYHHRG